MASFFINMINYLIKGVGAILSMLLSVFPTSPFTLISNSPIAQYLGTLNYFIPFSEAIIIGEAWLFCVGTWYIYSIVARWVKLVS